MRCRQPKQKHRHPGSRQSSVRKKEIPRKQGREPRRPHPTLLQHHPARFFETTVHDVIGDSSMAVPTQAIDALADAHGLAADLRTYFIRAGVATAAQAAAMDAHVAIHLPGVTNFLGRPRVCGQLLKWRCCAVATMRGGGSNAFAEALLERCGQRYSRCTARALGASFQNIRNRRSMHSQQALAVTCAFRISSGLSWHSVGKILHYRMVVLHGCYHQEWAGPLHTSRTKALRVLCVLEILRVDYPCPETQTQNRPGRHSAITRSALDEPLEQSGAATQP